MRKVLTSPVAVTQEEADNVSYPPNIHQCIVVFGFPSWSTTNILQDFQSFGDILRYKSPNMHEANNWLLIEYESAWQAQKAIAARNAKLMMNGAFLVGVMPLSKVINRIPKALDFVYEGANQSNFQEQKLQPMAMDISPLPIKSPLKQEQTPAVFIRTTHMMPGSAIPTSNSARYMPATPLANNMTPGLYPKNIYQLETPAPQSASLNRTSHSLKINSPVVINGGLASSQTYQTPKGQSSIVDSAKKTLTDFFGW
ncbi:hypothetical protein ROZALSC1DRAFT_20426 [Rozella allomycis CSF55]|uniref:RRM Nup35-type domain-containing protein n=1 Tax=Rozella allomycis (strain CSF55) TaxID=988480 RepID=A0A4V1J0H3_ROZAC|nr:hypothetical protein ROZALSC1DRAFT_20426 [Rozella allomycis CSF55]